MSIGTKKEEYQSIKEYTGKATGPEGEGREVFKTAKALGVTPNRKAVNGRKYSEVCTYPLSVLKRYFKHESKFRP